MWVSQRSGNRTCMQSEERTRERGRAHTSLSLTGLAQSRIPEQSAPPTRLTRERANDLVSRSLQRAHHPTLEQLCTDLIVEVCYSVGAVAMGGEGAKAQPNPPMAGTRVCMQGSASALPVSMAQSLTFLWQHASVRGPSGFVRKALLCS